MNLTKDNLKEGPPDFNTSTFKPLPPYPKRSQEEEDEVDGMGNYKSAQLDNRMKIWIGYLECSKIEI